MVETTMEQGTQNYHAHSWLRLWRHQVHGRRALRRDFPPAVLERIKQAVSACEGQHPGEIRFVLESRLSPEAIWAGVTPRHRAVEVFSGLRVWDTEHNNGVLIYLLLADRDVEIVADRGVAGGRVLPEEWSKVCRLMERHFREGDFADGAVAGIEAVADVLARHPAGDASVGNELPDAPLILG